MAIKYGIPLVPRETVKTFRVVDEFLASNPTGIVSALVPVRLCRLLRHLTHSIHCRAAAGFSETCDNATNIEMQYIQHCIR